VNLNLQNTQRKAGAGIFVSEGEMPMRRIIVSAVTAAVLIVIRQPGCVAQGGLPYGSYSRTCQNIRLNGDTLSASCQKVDGGWHNTSLDYRSCRGSQIINENGNLRCGGEGEWHGGEHRGGWQGGLPPGDYKRTCQNMYMEGNKLSGTCQKADGGWNNTSLNNVSQCRTRIVNENGNLRCEK
jgi:hypothetical protein